MWSCSLAILQIIVNVKKCKFVNGMRLFNKNFESCAVFVRILYKKKYLTFYISFTRLLFDLGFSSIYGSKAVKGAQKLKRNFE